MPPADASNDLLATSVSHSNGFISFSFIRTLFSNNSRDISLVSPRFFVYGANGTATFSDGRISRVGQHPDTPIISNERVTLGTPSQCPGKGLGGERMNSYLLSLCFFLSLSLSVFLSLSVSLSPSLSLSQVYFLNYKSLLHPAVAATLMTAVMVSVPTMLPGRLEVVTSSLWLLVVSHGCSGWQLGSPIIGEW